MTAQSRYHDLLAPVVASLDGFIQAAQTRRPSATHQLDRMRQFVEYKIYAMLDSGDQIRQQVSAGTVSVVPNLARSRLEAVVDRGARFRLFVLVDGFLFESGCLRDALLQLVNVVFNLGIAEDDPKMVAKVKSALPVTDETATGLEKWTSPNRKADWLDWLEELRNRTTHRHVVELPEQLSGTDDERGEIVWRSEPGIATRDGGFEPLVSFVERAERNMTALLTESCERLTRTLEALAGARQEEADR